MRMAICALWTLCALGCGSAAMPSDAIDDLEQAPVVDVLARETTDGELALSNLDAQIAETERVLAKFPGRLDLIKSLTALYLSRTQYRGSYDDFARVDDLTVSALEAHPDVADVQLLRADYLSSVHLFGEALALLARAEQLGAPSQDKRRATYWLATGAEGSRMAEVRNTQVQKARTFETLSSLAAVQAARGEFARADELYVEAMRTYRDVSPLPVAWVSFQRGVMWGEMAGKPVWAKLLYREAVRRLPGYVVANVHLAELEFADGEHEQAIARLERIAQHTSDPEAAGRLAGWLEQRDATRAASYRSRADARYRELLARHAAAFRDHASEFYAAAGHDAALSLQLALDNLAERDVPRSYLIALNAAAADGKHSKVCELARGAARFPWHVNLQHAVRALAGTCE